jgi:hypothetical protein
MTFLLYCVLPLSVVLYIMGTGKRRSARGDARRHPGGWESGTAQPRAISVRRLQVGYAAARLLSHPT